MLERNESSGQEKDPNQDQDYDDDEDLEEEELVPPREIIRCRNVTKEYDLDEYIVIAVDDVSFDVMRGEFLAIQGPSGAGKTTLISMIAGLDNPSHGEIWIERVRVSDLGEETMSTFRVLNVGFIFQNYNLISSLTASENIMFPMQLAGIELDIQKLRVADLLNMVKLPEREEHLPFQLSAGEQQRVGIARALANDPPIILADEPTANLDKKSSDIIAELFQKMSSEGKTIIVVTHDDRLIKHAHRVISFDDGKIVNTEQIREPPSEEEVPSRIKFPDSVKKSDFKEFTEDNDRGN